MGTPQVTWHLQRQGHPQTIYHLDVLLQTREVIIVGRKACSNVQIVCNGKTVSRTHCALKLIGDVWHVEDLKSMNGVFINGTLISSSEPVPLSHGDALGIGCKDDSESDYFVFIVNKTVIKDENQNSQNVVSLPQGQTPSVVNRANGDPVMCGEGTRVCSPGVEAHSLNTSILANVPAGNSSATPLAELHTILPDTPCLPSTSKVEGIKTLVNLPNERVLVKVEPTDDMPRGDAGKQLVSMNTKSIQEKGMQLQAKENCVEGKSAEKTASSSVPDSANITSLKAGLPAERTTTVIKTAESVTTSSSSADKAKPVSKQTTTGNSNGAASEKLPTPASVNEKVAAMTSSDKSLSSGKSTNPSPSIPSTSVSTSTVNAAPAPSALKGTSDSVNKRHNSDIEKSAKSLKPPKKIVKDQLKMKCIVVLERLTAAQINRYTNGQATSPGKRSKQRVRRLILSDDEEEEEPVKPSETKWNKKNKETKKCEAHRNVDTARKEVTVPKNSDSPNNSTDKTPEVLPSTSKTKFVVEKLSSSLGDQTDKSNAVKPPNQQESQYTMVIDISDSEDEIFPLNSGSSPIFEEETLIDLCSDDEIFSCTPRQVKSEPMDEVDQPAISHLVDKPLDEPTEEAEQDSSSSSSGSDSDNSANDSPDSDDRFFPELSQKTVEEFEAQDAAEEEAEKATREKPSTSDGRRTKDTSSDKLQSIIAQQRSKPKDKSALPTPPKRLDPFRPHTNRRFTLNTACGKEKRDDKKKSALLGKLKIDDKTQGFARCVKEAMSKCDKAPIHPAPELPKRKDDDKKLSEEKRSKSTKKTEETTSKKNAHKSKTQGVIVKAKNTKRSRGDMLTDEMTHTGTADSRTKRPSEGSLTGFTIPKRPRTDGESSSSAEPGEASKRKSTEEDLEDINVDVDLRALGPIKPSTFKPPVKRVARLPHDSAEHRDGNHSRPVLTDPAAALKPPGPSKKASYHQPRTTAIPLGSKLSTLPRTSVDDWRKSRNVKKSTGGTSASLTATADSSADETLRLSPETDSEPGHSGPVPEIISDGVSPSRGILVRPGVSEPKKGKPRPRLSFGPDQVREIETKEEVAAAMAEEERAQQAAAALTNRVAPSCSSELVPYNGNPQSGRPPNGHVQEHRSRFEFQAAVQPTINSMLARICSWSYLWFEEQKAIANQKNREDRECCPPPLLCAVKIRNQILPELAAVPVLTSYRTQEQYQDVFYPLMLHEIWGVVSKDVENGDNLWKARVLLHGIFKEESLTVLVRCESLVPEGSTRLWDHDLVRLTLEGGRGETQKHIMGFTEHIKQRAATDADMLIDKRLSEHCRRPCVRVSFLLRLKPTNLPKFNEVYTIKRLSSLRIHVKQFNLVAEIANSPLHKIILDPISCSDGFELLQPANPAQTSSQLNEIQSQAVSAIVETVLKTPHREPKVALLQGPPGTGKSQVIVQLVLKLLPELKARRQKILICAPSNNAVDEIAARLTRHKGLNLIRIGVPSSINAKLADITLDAIATRIHVEQMATLKHSHYSSNIDGMLREIAEQKKTKTKYTTDLVNANKQNDRDNARLLGRKLEETEQKIEAVVKSLQKVKLCHANLFPEEMHNARYHALLGADVICTTLNSCRSRDMEYLFIGSARRDNSTPAEIMCCIIDEASQCSEPESLTPIGLGVSKLVLIGDPDQLPATVNSTYAQKHRFEQSLFNRFFAARQGADVGSNVTMLSTQYRMAPPICEWPSKYFYGKKLVTDPELIRNGPGALAGRIFNYRVLNVYDGVETAADGNSKSVMNEKEAKVVAGIVQVLAAMEPNIHKHLGIITFYQRQKQCIIETLRNTVNLRGSVEVNTVDAFQGQEKDIIIVSCVRANRDMGFLSSLQRMNVALTRARHSLIVCGHFDTLCKNEAWRDLINDAKVRGFSHMVLSDYTFQNFENVIMRKS